MPLTHSVIVGIENMIAKMVPTINKGYQMKPIGTFFGKIFGGLWNWIKETAWIQPLLIVGALVAFIIYATFRAFEGKHYFVEPLISPFYSPCLSTVCVEGAAHFGTPIGSVTLFGLLISPALFILIFPLGFRLTCSNTHRLWSRWQSNFDSRIDRFSNVYGT